MKHSFCEDWEFTRHWTEAFGKGLPVPKQQAVRLPHTCREMPLHYASPADYEMVCGYRKRFRVPPVQAAPRLFLRFDGAAHQAVVRVNGRVAGQHRGGYTGFTVEITDLVDREGENLLTVQLDTREDPAIPPFGFVIDYLTYGGLYREVWLEATAESRLTDLFVYTPTLHDAVVQWTAELTSAAAAVRIRLETADGTLLAQQTAQAAETGKMQFSVPDAQPWDTEHPVLHHAVAELLNAAGQPIDRKQVTFGFRTAEFRADGFYLNGKKTFLRGLNRHQSYPYIGYAAPESLQREDARILQEELHCTAVRTSHYPQSQYFLDECDRRGLLVFTELPGWQHIGDAAWKDAACAMLQEMILQNRNHPSIILWGVHINESVDDDAFYNRTNKIAHQLNPSRATSGVRYLEKSHLLEDVYAYNDFSHNGVTPGAKPKKDVTPDMGKALLISECNGHMYPTKPFDDGPHRQEHALRHVRVQNAAYASGEHAGCFGWCMFDYQTHKDFGSGDRICYHGVLDSFRNPKLAAAVYASQGDTGPVLAVSSSMDIGDNPAGQLGTAYVFSNAQQVRLYKNDVFVTALRQSEWTALPHPPFVMDDTIGELLETQEHFSPAKAAAVRDCLLAAGKYGLAGLPLAYKVKFGWCMLRYKMSFADGVALYGHDFVDEGSLNIQRVDFHSFQFKPFDIIGKPTAFQKLLNAGFHRHFLIRVWTDSTSNFKLHTVFRITEPNIHTLAAVGAFLHDLLHLCASRHDRFDFLDRFVAGFIRQFHSQEGKVDVLGKTVNGTWVALAERGAALKNALVCIRTVGQRFQHHDDIIVALDGRLGNVFFIGNNGDQFTKFFRMRMQFHKSPP